MSEFSQDPPAIQWTDETEDWPKRTWDFWLRAMYENTQEWAKNNGVQYVRLRRGSSVYQGAVNSVVAAKFRPMSSFTTRVSVANQFGYYHVEAIVPVEWLIGTSVTGYGCYNEYEWVVLGGVHDVKVTK